MRRKSDSEIEKTNRVIKYEIREKRYVSYN